MKTDLDYFINPICDMGFGCLPGVLRHGLVTTSSHKTIPLKKDVAIVNSATINMGVQVPLE
jgi:hypothetical protein